MRCAFGYINVLVSEISTNNISLYFIDLQKSILYGIK